MICELVYYVDRTIASILRRLFVDHASVVLHPIGTTELATSFQNGKGLVPELRPKSILSPMLSFTAVHQSDFRETSPWSIGTINTVAESLSLQHSMDIGRIM